MNDSATRDKATVEARKDMTTVLRHRVDRVLDRDAKILAQAVRNDIAASVANEVFAYLSQLFDMGEDAR